MYFYVVCSCVCTMHLLHGCIHVSWCTHVRGQLSGVGSLLSSCGSLGIWLNSSGLAVSAFAQWATSLAHPFQFNCILSQFGLDQVQVLKSTYRTGQPYTWELEAIVSVSYDTVYDPWELETLHLYCMILSYVPWKLHIFGFIWYDSI